jgi:hypothetical protein
MINKGLESTAKTLAVVALPRRGKLWRSEADETKEAQGVAGKVVKGDRWS